ncbi:DUF1360 domain-containing protein [Bacillus sp. FJAT-50079]|uniref:DUF1360 domain-containing protein n=1 Tax=Bacillus sp. FJAT-50079 TaxID=2833577 RepID=UPI001BCA54E8|nr:DUF1360 domain-containing protein [Bacillus sp. FJAT-50079]MBS4207943.1 DUF1360 domain-containing protein [Bacillus sp. FJAT-50079]
MNMDWFQFTLFSIAVFRLTRLIVYDQITAFIRAPFMIDYEEMDEHGDMVIYQLPRESGLRGWIGALLSCYWCTGVWAAIGLISLHLIYPQIAQPITIILAVAGLAAVIETAIQAMIKE